MKTTKEKLKVMQAFENGISVEIKIRGDKERPFNRDFGDAYASMKHGYIWECVDYTNSLHTFKFENGCFYSFLNNKWTKWIYYSFLFNTKWRKAKEQPEKEKLKRTSNEEEQRCKKQLIDLLNSDNIIVTVIDAGQDIVNTAEKSGIQYGQITFCFEKIS
jgi:hypothetical protein